MLRTFTSSTTVIATAVHRVTSVNTPYTADTLLYTLYTLHLQQPNCRDWQSLAGLRLWQLCVGRGSHSRVARLLSALVGPQSGLDPLSAADTYAGELRRRCYGFFSEGDVLTYDGMKELRRYAVLCLYHYYLCTADGIDMLALYASIQNIIDYKKRKQPVLYSTYTVCAHMISSSSCIISCKLFSSQLARLAMLTDTR